MAYQAADAERGYVSYDPVADEGTLEYSTGRACRKPVWIAGLVVCGVVLLGGTALSARSSAFTQSAVDYDATAYMPKMNPFACLQSSCNEAVGGLATFTEDDDDARDLVLCLTRALDGKAGNRCFKGHKVTPTTEAIYTCGVCEHCFEGDVSAKECARFTHQRTYNDLRGAPAATGRSNGDNHGQYIPGGSYNGPPAFTQREASDHIPKAYANSFFDTENADIIPRDVVPRDVVPTNTPNEPPSIRDEVSADFEHVNEDVEAGLERAEGLSDKKKHRIEDRIAHELRRVRKEISPELRRIDHEISRASRKTSDKLEDINDKVNAELDHANKEANAGIDKGNDEAEAGLQKADDEIAKHVDENPNVPDNVPGYIPQLGSSPADSKPVSSSVAAVEDEEIEGSEQSEALYVPTDFAVDQGHAKEHSKRDHHRVAIQKEPSKRARPATRMPVAKDGKKPAEKPRETEKRIINGCTQKNCHAALGGLAEGIGGTPGTRDLLRCVEGSKATDTKKCFKRFPSPEGDTLRTCMICNHCISGKVAPEECRALEQPNYIPGHF